MISVFHFFEKMNKGHLKIVNAYHKKLPDVAILSF